MVRHESGPLYGESVVYLNVDQVGAGQIHFLSGIKFMLKTEGSAAVCVSACVCPCDFSVKKRGVERSMAHSRSVNTNR